MTAHHRWSPIRGAVVRKPPGKEPARSWGEGGECYGDFTAVRPVKRTAKAMLDTGAASNARVGV